MSSVIDDHLLLDLLIGDIEPPWLAGAGDARIFTTMSWYDRLGRAANLESSAGALSRRVGALERADREAVLAWLDDLPRRIGVVPVRKLVPPMAILGSTRSLNFLGAEALATAILTDSTILVRTHSPPLAVACDALAVPYLVVS